MNKEKKQKLLDFVDKVDKDNKVCGCDSTPGIDSALDDCGDILMSAFTLSTEFERAVRGIEPVHLAGQLEPYEQKLAAMAREVDNLKKAALRVRHIQRELIQMGEEARRIIETVDQDDEAIL